MEKERLVYVATVGTNIVVEPAPLDSKTLDQRTAELTDPVSYGIYSQWIQKQRFPDVVYLLHTDGSKKTYDDLQQKWQVLLPNIISQVIPAFDLDGAAATVSEIARKEKGAQITINYSSGTNPMQAGTLTRAVDHVLLGDVAQIVYVQEFRERRKEGKGTFDTMELKRVEPLRLYYTRLFEMALNLFRQFSYERAVVYFQQAADLAPSEQDRQRAEGYKELCEAYLLWDAFAYRSVPGKLKAARRALNDVDTSVSEEAFRKAEYLEQQVLKHGKSFPLLFHVVDMLENSVRDLLRERKHECLLKLYRFYELLFHWRLAKTYGFFNAERKEELATAWPAILKSWKDTKKLKSESDAEEALEKIRRGEEDFYGREMELILKQLKDQVLLDVEEGLKALGTDTWALRKLRNDSPFHHGLETGNVKVKSEMLQGLIQLGYSVLQNLVADPKTPQQSIRGKGFESLRALRKTGDVSAEELKTLQQLTRPFSYDPLTLLKP